MHKIISLVLLTSSTAAMALPTFYSTNTYLKEKSGISSRSTLLGDTDDPSTVWVLPPNAGQVKFKGLVESGNARFCNGMKLLVLDVEEIDKERRTIRKEVFKRRAEVEEARKVVDHRRDELAKLSNLPEIEQIDQQAILVDDLSVKVDDLYEELKKTKDREQRKILKARIKEVKEELKIEKKTLRDLKKEYRKSYRAYQRAQKSLESAEKAHKNYNKYLKELYTELRKMSNEIMEIYKERGKMQGAIASMDYNSQWSNEIAQLQTAYSDVNFVKMPTYNARVQSNFIPTTDKESYYDSLPPVAAYNVNGNGQLPYGVRKNKAERAGTGFPENVGVDLMLNLVGACPALDDAFFAEVDYDVKRDGNGVPLFGLSTTYEYDVAYKYRVEASYNLWTFFEKIVKKGTKGGFFTSQAYVDVLESEMTKDAFTFKIENQAQMPAAEVKSIKQEIKSELMNRVLTTVATPDPKGTPETPKVGTPPELGSVVIGKGLNKICGWNVYCQVGSWVFRVAGAFGNKEARTTFRKITDRTASEIWDTTTMVPRQAIATYER